MGGGAGNLIAFAPKIIESLAVVLWLRSDRHERVERRDAVTVIPSVLLASAVLARAPASDEWPLIAVAPLALGACLAAWSLTSLGRSFAWLPQRRTLVCRGPYKWIRHPAYAGECLLVFAMSAAAWHVRVGADQAASAFLLLASFLALVPRINAEERLLSSDHSWAAYRSRTAYRLVPGLW